MRPGERRPQVDHEDQGVGALDAALAVAGGAVAVGGRDHQEDSAADGLTDQRLVHPGMTAPVPMRKEAGAPW